MEEEDSFVEKEIVNDILHKHDQVNTQQLAPFFEIKKPEPVIEENKQAVADLELEIKIIPEKIADAEEEEPVFENLPPYEPTLDLRDYKYPTLSLLETHGSEKIVQDANELENNKNQIISTLRTILSKYKKSARR